MTTYLNVRDVLTILRDTREYKDRHTGKEGVVETLDIQTKDGNTIINIFKEEEEE